MRIIIIWLWGAGLSSLWWAGVLFNLDPLLAFAMLGSVITIIMFGSYCANHWMMKE